MKFSAFLFLCGLLISTQGFAAKYSCGVALGIDPSSPVLGPVTVDTANDGKREIIRLKDNNFFACEGYKDTDLGKQLLICFFADENSQIKIFRQPRTHQLLVLTRNRRTENASFAITAATEVGAELNVASWNIKPLNSSDSIYSGFCRLTEK